MLRDVQLPGPLSVSGRGEEDVDTVLALVEAGEEVEAVVEEDGLVKGPKEAIMKWRAPLEVVCFENKGFRWVKSP